LILADSKKGDNCIERDSHTMEEMRAYKVSTIDFNDNEFGLS
jgi:hypothetical protein